MVRYYRLLLLVPLVACLFGCTGLVGNGPGAQITIDNAFKSIQAGSAPVALNAVGPSGQPLNVTWSLTYANQSCTPICGALQSSGQGMATYTPPAAPPSFGEATLTVVLGADAWVGNFQITDAVSVSIVNKFSTQFTGGPQVTVTVNVSNDAADAGVTWALMAGGSNCSPACGTLTPVSGGPPFTATYLPPTSVPSGANASPTIAAKSVTAPSESDNFTFAIASSSSLFKGNYALLLRGYYLDPTQDPMAIAGSVTADGNGNITGGEFDIDNGGGITHIASPVTGTYSIDLSFNGSTRGKIVITSFTFAGSVTNIAFDFVLSADGTRGRAVESDGAYINVGAILQQSASALSAANPAGTYAFGLDSDAPVGGRIVEAGQFVLASSGITGGLVDRSQAGVAAPIYSDVSLSPSAAASPDSSGRGTLTLTAQGESVQYAYYVVNAGQLNLIEIDNGATSGVQAGVAYVQKLPFTVNTTSVLQLTGMDAVPGTPSSIGPDVIIGVLNISGGNAFTLTFDENDLGNVLTKHPASGAVTFDPTTGRGAFTDPGGFENGFLDSAVFYMYDAGKGFIIDADISTCVISTNPCNPVVPATGPITNNAFSGTFVPQADGPFTASGLSGNLILGSGASASPDIPDIAASVAADGVSNLNAIGDIDSLPTQNGNPQNYKFNGTYSLTNHSLGYGTAILPSFIFGQFTPPINPPASFYLIGPNQFVLIGTQNGIYSGISFLDAP